MPKFCSIVLLILASVLLTGQEVVEHGYGIELSPHHGSTRISGGQGVNFLELERLDSLETGAAGYSVGLIYTSRVNKIGFTTGLRFTETGYNVAEQPSRMMGSTQTFSQVIRANYLSIPFELNFYQDITPKDRVFFTLGLAAHFQLKTKVTQTNFSDGEKLGEVVLERDSEEEFRSPIPSLNTAIGFDRKFSERWSMRIEPFFQFFLQGNLRAEFNQTNRNFYQLGGRVLVRRAIF